jgi:hypothetical protein
MEGRRLGKDWLWSLSTVLCVLIVSVGQGRAEILHTGIRFEPGPAQEKVVRERYEAAQPTPARIEAIDGEKVLTGLKRAWKDTREELTLVLLEAAVTMFFIKTGPPPPPHSTKSHTPNNPPPQGQGSPPPNNPPPPPPPTGQAEPPPIDPPPGPPTVGSPEPASLAIGFLGAGFVSYYGWRKRRKN